MTTEERSERIRRDVDGIGHDVEGIRWFLLGMRACGANTQVDKAIGLVDGLDWRVSMLEAELRAGETDKEREASE